MSTDSTELHFVRCPSCRSLVPASSKTCRMCGAALDAGGKGDDASGEARRSGRVRQRTMSSGTDELNSTVHKIREEMGVEAQAAKPEATSAIDPLESDDPLSAYIEEIEAGEVGHAEPAPAKGPPAKPAAVAPAAPAYTPPPAEPPPAAAKPAALVKPAQAPTPEPENKTRVLVESGGKRKGPGLSFGGARREESDSYDENRPVAANRSAPQFDSDSGDSGDDARAEGSTASAAPRSTPPAPPRARQEEAHEEHSYDASRKPDRREEVRPPERRDDRRDEARNQQAGQPKQEAPRSYEVPRRNVLSGGRLVGWLVSYRDADGKAVEIREGKFFVSRSRVKDSDLVIDDRSVSSPHALCAIGVGQRLRIQDLMSDNGVFIKHRDEHEFIRISETADLEHGDWVKFGDVEYNVCLVAHVGEK
jgi:hypothetical protein